MRSAVIIRTISTFFFVGYLPLIPGTFASLIGVTLYYFIKDDVLMYSVVTLSLVFLGFLLVNRAEGLFKKKDARCIVIDEIAGMLLVFLFVPYHVKWMILGFLLFRLFDILKPYPIYKIQTLKGSIGVMGDDILAAFYTNLTLQIILRLASFITS